MTNIDHIIRSAPALTDIIQTTQHITIAAGAWGTGTFTTYDIPIAAVDPAHSVSVLGHSRGLNNLDPWHSYVLNSTTVRATGFNSLNTARPSTPLYLTVYEFNPDAVASIQDLSVPGGIDTAIATVDPQKCQVFWDYRITTTMQNAYQCETALEYLNAGSIRIRAAHPSTQVRTKIVELV